MSILGESANDLPIYKKFNADAIHECSRRAVEARHTAESATDQGTKSDFLEIERRWLFVARCFQSDAAKPSKTRLA